MRRPWAASYPILDVDEFDDCHLWPPFAPWPGDGFACLAPPSRKAQEPLRKRSRPPQKAAPKQKAAQRLSVALAAECEARARSELRARPPSWDSASWRHVRELAWLGYDSEPGDAPSTFSTRAAFIAKLEEGYDDAAWHWACVAKSRGLSETGAT